MLNINKSLKIWYFTWFFSRKKFCCYITFIQFFLVFWHPDAPPKQLLPGITALKTLRQIQPCIALQLYFSNTIIAIGFLHDAVLFDNFVMYPLLPPIENSCVRHCIYVCYSLCIPSKPYEPVEQYQLIYTLSSERTRWFWG